MFSTYPMTNLKFLSHIYFVICEMFSIWSSLQILLFDKEFPNKPLVLHVYSKSLLKTLWVKEYIARNPFAEISTIFIKFKNCRLQTLSV